MKKILVCIIVSIISAVLFSCAGAHFSSGIGIGINCGPYGPRITPSINVGIYGGGYR